MSDDALFLGESQTVEYKESLPKQSEKYLKTVIAFANSGGGQLVFGIEDNSRRIVGLDNDTLFKTMDAIVNSISDNCEPRIVPDLSLKTIEDKTILIVTIAPGTQKPYYLKSRGLYQGTYIRVGGTSRPVEGYTLKELILEGSNRSYDQQPYPELTVTPADIETLCDHLYARALKNARSDAEKESIRRPTKNTLISWGVIRETDDRLCANVSYALLTGHMQNQPMIQCGIFKNTDRSVFLDHRDIRGPLQDQLDGAMLYVMEKLNRAIKIEGSYGIDHYELPIDSIRELIANALTHRSYLEPSNIQVALFDDRLEITSPGMLLPGVTIEKMKEGFSKIRNKAIAEAFAYMRIIEHWGSGIPRFIKDCEAYQLPSPQLIDFDGDFRINIFRKINFPQHLEDSTNSTNHSTDSTNHSTDSTNHSTDSSNQSPNATVVIPTASLTKIEQLIVEYVKNFPDSSQSDIAKNINCKVHQIKYAMQRLTKKGVLTRAGNRRIGHWVVQI